MTKQEAGRLGGLSTVNKYGNNHMKSIGKLGAKKLWELYRMVPYDLSKFKLVKRS
jgi:hypothetical protein